MFDHVIICIILQRNYINNQPRGLKKYQWRRDKLVKNMGEPYKTWMNERMGVDLLPRRRRPKKFNNIELTSMYKKKEKKEAIQRFITCNYFKPPPSSLYTQIGEERIINGKIYFIE